MTSKNLVFAPELEALLRVMASDPRSSLLRVRRPARVKDFLGRGSAIRESRTGLRAAERELLRVHREELAQLLREACVMLFYAVRERRGFLHHSRTVGEAIRVASPREWSARGESALERVAVDGLALAGLDLIRACLGNPARSGLPIVQLARAAQVLVPSGLHECYIGLDLVLGGRPATGTRVLQDLLASGPRRIVASHTSENLGLACGLAGDDRTALLHYRHAAEIAGDRPAPVMAWLVCAVTTVQEKQARRAATILEDLVAKDHPALEEFLGLKKNHRARGLLVPDGRARRLAARIRDRVGPASERIIDVLL